MTDAIAAAAPVAAAAHLPPEGYPEHLCWPPVFAYWPHEYYGANDMPLGNGIFASAELAEAGMLDRWPLGCVSPDYKGRGYDLEYASAADRRNARYRSENQVGQVSWRALQQSTTQHNLPVWQDAAFWNTSRALDIRADHYVAVAEKDSALLAYVSDPKKGQRSVRTPIKPGKYLSKFFADILTAKEIAFYATWQASGERPCEYNNVTAFPIQFAHTPGEIAEVYRAGPDSCMSGDMDVTTDDGDEVHPASVYGAGDLALAFIADAEGKPIARALCWPARKALGRVYPTPDCWRSDGFDSREASQAIHDALERRLLAEGYSSLYADRSLFNGARVLRISTERGYYVMPYLDCSLRFVDEGRGEPFTLHHNRGFISDNTTGLATGRPEYEHQCYYCEEGTDDFNVVYSSVSAINGGYSARNYCDHCCENHTFRCDGFEEVFCDGVERSHTACGGTYTDVYLESHGSTSDKSGETRLNESLVTVVTDAVTTEDWFQDEADEDAFICVVTGVLTACDYARTDRGDVSADVSDEALDAYNAGDSDLGVGLISDPSQIAFRYLAAESAAYAIAAE